MTSDELKQIEHIMQPFREGKVIEYNPRHNALGNCFCDPDWHPRSSLTPEHVLLFPQAYRVKPEPKRFWLNVYGNTEAYCYKYATKAEADKMADAARVGCYYVEVLNESTL